MRKQITAVAAAAAMTFALAGPAAAEKPGWAGPDNGMTIVETAIDASGEPFGYTRAFTAFEEAAQESPDEIVAHLDAEVRRFNGDRPPHDDVTFVVLKVRA